MNAPDGSLYVLDISRELIEGAAFLPPEFMNHLDPISGNDQGRIYRIAPQGFVSKTPKLSSLSTLELVKLLDHTTGWHRDVAGRLLYTRQDQSAVSPVRQLVTKGQTAEGRFLALYNLHGLHALDEASVLAGLDDERPIVRWHALKCAESLCNQAPAVLHAMSRMADVDDIRVRYQLAFSIGAALAGTKNETLAKLAIQDVNNSWMQIAILSSLGRGADKVLVTLASNEAFVANKNGMTLLKELCSQIGLRNRPHEVSAVINTISENDKLSSPLIESFVSN